MDSNIIALDVGEQRVGIAVAHITARLPRPLKTLKRGQNFWDELAELLAKESAGMIVVGMPRSLEGNDTSQTKATRDFIRTLQEHTDLPVETVDEALTTKQAESELTSRGKHFTRDEVDALAAVYILNNYFQA